MEKAVSIGLFLAAVAVFLIAYEKPGTSHKKITGEAGISSPSQSSLLGCLNLVRQRWVCLFQRQ